MKFSIKDKSVLFPLIISIVTIVVFSNSLTNGFVEWDDNIYVYENSSLDNSSISNLFTEFVAGNYHPITMLSYRIEKAIFGLNPFYFHLDNLILHLINSVLVFFLVKRLLKKDVVALFCALIFAIHPMHVESVSWISERKDLLYALFYLLGLLYYIKNRENQTIKFHIFLLSLFLLSLLSKAMAITFPFALFLIDYFIDSKFYLLKKIHLIFISVLFGIIAITAQGQAFESGSLEEHTLWDKIMFSSYSLLVYSGKLFIPIKQTAYYNYPLKHIGLPKIIFWSPIILTLFAVIFYKFRKNKTIVFGVLFFILSLSTVLQVLSVGGAILAERYTYMAYIGLIIILVALLEKSMKSIYIPLLVIFVLAMSYKTYQVNKWWNTTESLWTNSIESNPEQYVPYMNRANYYVKTKKYKKAYDDANIFMTLCPRNQLGYFISAYSLDKITPLSEQKYVYDEITNNYKKALSFGKLRNEDQFVANIGIARINSNLNFSQEAIKYGNTADSLSSYIVKSDSNYIPSVVESKYILGLNYFKIGELDIAEEYLKTALKMDSLYYNAFIDLSLINKAKKEFKMSEENLKKSIQIKPVGEFRHYYNLSSLLNDQKRYSEAKHYIDLAIKNGATVDPNYINYLNSKI